MIEIPDNYFSNLSSYEEFVIKTNLLGYDISDKEVLELLNTVENYYWFVINGHLCFLDNKGNKAENVILKGSFNCSYSNLTSLEGCPKEVGGNFFCSCNRLTSLKGCPEEVGGDFFCYNNSQKLLKPKKLKCHGYFCNG